MTTKTIGHIETRDGIEAGEFNFAPAACYPVLDEGWIEDEDGCRITICHLLGLPATYRFDAFERGVA